MSTAAERESAKVDEIAAFIAAQPYDRWHWVVETHGRDDLVALLRANEGSPKRVKAHLRTYVRMMCERERECAFE